jgi:hypothetical protein
MIRIHDPESFQVPEPRIAHLGHQLERLLRVVELEKDGVPVEIDGFRLKHLSDWVTHRTNTAMNALTPISSLCNSKCDFCFEENLPYAREQSLMSVEEAQTRLKYYSPDTGNCLFPSNRNHMETFLHPKALDIIRMARSVEPTKLFWITSNGSHFTEPVIEELAKLKPLIFKLSLNAADEATNHNLMHTGKLTNVALEAPKLLHKYRIPFMGGIVAWPTLTLDSIEETVRYLEKEEAYAIRIRLPLVHKWMKHQPTADLNEHWKRVASFAEDLRGKVDVPLFIEPPLFLVTPIVPEVDGVVKNSPAYRAGIRPKDVVRSINNNKVRTRIESEALLGQLRMQNAQEVPVEVERNGEKIAVVLKERQLSEDTYPYSNDFFYRGENFGIFHVEDFRLNYIDKFISIIKKHNASRVMLFSSKIVAELCAMIIAKVPEFDKALSGVTLFIETIEDNALGGNFNVLDSRTIDDYIAVINQRQSEGEKVDLVLIPDAFGSPWGMDINGRSEFDIVLECGVPVERIDWYLIYGREV